MTLPTEGTIVLDGLLEGPLPNLPDGRERLHAWAASARRQGLAFSLQIESSTFSLLASNAPLLSATLGDKPSETVAGCLQELVRAFTAAEGRRLVSTLRSLEYRPGVEVQSLYVIGPDGEVEVRQREVQAETAPPPEPLSTKEKARFAITALVAIALLVAVSTFFVDYRQMYRQMRDRITPYPIEQLKIDPGRFAPYLAVIDQRVEKGQILLHLTLTAKRPLDEAQVDQWAATLPFSSTLALQSLSRGYITCEYFDRDGHSMQSALVRVADLRTSPEMILALPLPQDNQLARIVLTP